MNIWQGSVHQKYGPIFSMVQFIKSVVQSQEVCISQRPPSSCADVRPSERLGLSPSFVSARNPYLLYNVAPVCTTVAPAYPSSGSPSATPYRKSSGMSRESS